VVAKGTVNEKEYINDEAKDKEENINKDFVEQQDVCTENGTAEPEHNQEEGLPASDEFPLEDLLAKEKAKSEEYYNQMLRLQAEFENYRKRVVREKEDLLKYGAEQLIINLLPVMDSFDSALQTQSEDSEKLFEGIQKIANQIYDILKKEGLEIIPTVGEVFDPEIHEAVMKEESEEYPENTVTMELRRGYSYKGKVIRAAMVKVAG
jgi:molecular chaperone GrpE